MSESTNGAHIGAPSVHPAVIAWQQIGQTGAISKVEPLKENKKTGVYRLATGEGTIIAKRTWREAAMRERLVYSEILAGCSLDMIRFLAYLEGSDPETGWIFLEDAGDDAFDPHSQEHREAAARWLASLHTLTAGLALPESLEDRGPAHYLRILRRGLHSIETQSSNPYITREDRRVLIEVAQKLSDIEAQWRDVEDVCSALPVTLVHGDFVGKNIRVRRGKGGLTIFPFDWELVGRGVPVTDLAKIPAGVYLAAVLPAWGRLTSMDVEVLTNTGWVFRLLEWISWARFRLRGQWAGLAIERQLRYYNSWLEEALTSKYWLGRKG